jgi:hypothetical protein
MRADFQCDQFLARAIVEAPDLREHIQRGNYPSLRFRASFFGSLLAVDTNNSESTKKSRVLEWVVFEDRRTL